MPRTHAEAFEQAQDLALNKPPVLIGRAHVLSQMVDEALKQYFESAPSQGVSVRTLEKFFARVGNYLRVGYLNFSDLGISTESQFRFIELGQETVGLADELAKLKDIYNEALDVGHNRKEEYQRMILNGFLAEDAREYAAKELP